MKVEREIGGDERHVEEIDETKPELRAFDEMGGDAAEITEKDDDHECGRLAVDTLGTIGPDNRERPRETEREEHCEF